MRIVIVQPSRQARLLGFVGRFGATLVIGFHCPAIVDGRHLYKDPDVVAENVALPTQ